MFYNVLLYLNVLLVLEKIFNGGQEILIRDRYCNYFLIYSERFINARFVENAWQEKHY